MAERVVYVYGIVPAALDVAGAPAGVEGAPVEVEREGDVSALVSRLDGSAYARERVEPLLADVAWIGPRAVAHDRVVTWASDAGPIVPLKMFTLFSDRDAVRAMLRERASQLGATLARVAAAREYALRVFRIESELLTHIGELSPRVAELERQAAEATPGQRYLLARKAEGERRGEMARVSSQVARDVFAALERHAVGTAREPLPRQQPEGAAGVAVLNAFFLVGHDAVEAFQRAVTELARRHEPMGFRFEFTGPWPPYHFVAEGDGRG